MFIIIWLYECYKKSMDYYNLSFDDNNHVIEINDDLPF